MDAGAAMTFSMLGRAGHPRLVGTFSGFLNVILFFPSGAIYPVESFPPWLRTFAHFNPENLESHASELYSEPALQTAKISEAIVIFVPRKYRIEKSSCRNERLVGVH